MNKERNETEISRFAIAGDTTGTNTKKRLHVAFQRRDVLSVLVGIVFASAVFGIAILVQHTQVPLRPQTSQIDSPWIPATVKHWEPQIDAMSKKYDVDPTLIAIIMTLESGGDPRANSGQATGLMQISPATAQDIASKYLKIPVSKYNLYDPNTSIEFGAAYLNFLRNTFGSYTQAPSYDLTAEAVGAGYNGGPGAAADLLSGKGVVDEQTVLYSRNVFYFWRERHSSSSPAYLRWRDESGGIRLIQAAQKNQ
jgi:soluble lytic murein transglycosylase-like protein